MKLFAREIVDCIKKWFDKPEIIVLLGARQVGKTCLMKLLIQELKPRKCRWPTSRTISPDL
ncbi:MAG: AAA family ATPase [Elusimicrobiota bacterium]